MTAFPERHRETQTKGTYRLRKTALRNGASWVARRQIHWYANARPGAVFVKPAARNGGRVCFAVWRRDREVAVIGPARD